MDQVLLAIDVGTSACKVTAFDKLGQPVAAASRSYELYTPAPGHVEQDPNSWWDAICEASQVVTSQLVDASVVGVGIAGQSWSAIPVDAEGVVLANTPIWMDTRAQDLCEDVESRIDTGELLRFCGNRFSPTYSTPKILWFQKHRPAIYAKTRWFLQSNSFIVYRLTDKVSADKSQTYGLHVCDIRDGSYSDKVAAQLGIDLLKLPPVFDCDQVVGTVTAKASELTGIPAGTPVVAGGLDAACGALGAGVFSPTQVQEQGGQAGGLSVVCKEPLVDERLILSHHVVPGVWLLQGGTAAGGAALRWAREAVGGGKISYAEIDEMASAIPSGADGVVFLPYLAGERSPIWDPHALGVFFGMTLNTSQGHLFRAVMEGVTFALLDNVAAVEESGAQMGEIYAIGGAASSSLWTQMKADALGRSINVPEAEVATSLGAALLAGVGTGLFPDYASAVEATVRIKNTFYPTADPQVLDGYRKGIDIYRHLYPALRDVMAESALERSEENG